MVKVGSTWVQRWRVPLGFACAPLFFWLARPTARTLWAGGVIALLGLALRAWGSGHLRKNDKLAASGPYAHTRNPLYLGSFLMGLGFVAAAGWWPLLILFAALFLGIYWPVMRVEEGHLTEIFGEHYKAYAAAVPLFFPRLRPYADAPDARFDAQLYLRYREYQAALGVLAALGLLAVKAWFWR
jgi:protein-S-isoprenylcysteine O-methyltransferase Ste14